MKICHSHWPSMNFIMINLQFGKKKTIESNIFIFFVTRRDAPTLIEFLTSSSYLAPNTSP